MQNDGFGLVAQLKTSKVPFFQEPDLSNLKSINNSLWKLRFLKMFSFIKEVDK